MLLRLERIFSWLALSHEKAAANEHALGVIEGELTNMKSAFSATLIDEHLPTIKPKVV